MIDGEWDVRREGLAHRLAVLPGLGHGDLLEVFLDAIRNTVQEQRALSRSGLAEGFEGLLRSVDSQVDVSFLTTGYLTKDLTSDRRDVVHVLAVDRRYPFAANVVVITLAEVDDSAFGTGICVVGHDEAFLFNKLGCCIQLRDVTLVGECVTSHNFWLPS